jgi:putative ABC transport system substrate-binding protein
MVTNLSRPAGNVTGAVHFATALEGKRLGLLHEMLPSANPIGAMINPARLVSQTQVMEARAAAERARVGLVVVKASTEEELQEAFASVVDQKAGGLTVCADPYFFSVHQKIVDLAQRFKLPAIYEWRDFAAAGGLMSHGTYLSDSYRQNGLYAGRLLKGAKPSDLPVWQNTRLEFVINLKTAKALGLEVPAGLSASADEVIE